MTMGKTMQQCEMSIAPPPTLKGPPPFAAFLAASMASMVRTAGHVPIGMQRWVSPLAGATPFPLAPDAQRETGWKQCTLQGMGMGYRRPTLGLGGTSGPSELGMREGCLQDGLHAACPRFPFPFFFLSLVL